MLDVSQPPTFVGNDLNVDKYLFLFRPVRIYLAAPYSINGLNTANVKQFNFEQVSKVASNLMQKNHVVFSPVSHSHPIQIYGKLETNDLAFWMTQDLPFVEFCDVLCVLMLPGWDASPGVKREMEHAMKFKKDIYYLEFKNDEVIFYELEKFTKW
jgi:hypothetical protein